MIPQKRRIYLLNPGFQLKFAFYVTVVVLIASAIYPLTIYKITTHFSETLRAISPDGLQSLESIQTKLIILLSVWHLALTLLIFILSVFFSHRIAGPLYKLVLKLKSIREGRGIERIQFRKGDYFPEIADEFNETFSYIKNNYDKGNASINETISYLNNLSLSLPEDKKIVLEESIKKLKHIQHFLGEG